MEGDEMEMSKEELQKWIRENVKKNELISPDVLEKCNVLQSLLERREKQAAHLLKLCESVAACEAIVRKQYSLLGWEYRDADSDDDDDDDKTSSGNTPPSPCEVVAADTQAPCSRTTNGSTPLLPKLEDSELYKSCIKLKREPVVVLTRLPASKISSLRPRKPPNHSSEDESSNDSDTQWEPKDDSSDSDYSMSSYNSGPNKRRKTHQKTETLAKSHATPRASTNTDAKSNATKTSTPQANGNTNAKSNAKSNAKKTSTLQANGNTKAKSTTMKTSPKNTNGTDSCVVSTLCQSFDKASKTHTSAPQRQISVNMTVLARRRAMSWQQGKVMEIITREDGRLKYKISFEEKGKILVSGHHIAFNCMAKLEQLFVGARVVVKRDAEKPQFCPGVLSELPSRRNHMRFLVFIDDHTPLYVGLPSLHLVCRPLTDPLDDIPDDIHKNFMKEYVRTWPFPPHTQYRVGQTINAEFDGELQKCEVLVVDCSLIQVVFEDDKHKEWIYRGSLRLEHMINMSKLLKREESKSTTVDESSKSAQ